MALRGRPTADRACALCVRARAPRATSAEGDAVGLLDAEASTLETLETVLNRSMVWCGLCPRVAMSGTVWFAGVAHTCSPRERMCHTCGWAVWRMVVAAPCPCHDHETTTATATRDVRAPSRSCCPSPRPWGLGLSWWFAGVKLWSLSSDRGAPYTPFFRFHTLQPTQGERTRSRSFTPLLPPTPIPTHPNLHRPIHPPLNPLPPSSPPSRQPTRPDQTTHVLSAR